MTDREIHEPLASGPGDGLAFGIFFSLIHYDEDTDTVHPDVENVQNEMAQMRDDLHALLLHGYRVIVEFAADKAKLISFVYAHDPDLRGARPAGLLWSSHGASNGAVQTCDGTSLSYREIDPRAVDPELRTVIFSACHIGRWERFWMEALDARVYGWGQSVGMERAAVFCDPTSASSSRLDVVLERDFDLRPGSIREVHEAMHGDAASRSGSPVAALATEVARYLRVHQSGAPLWDEAKERARFDLVFDDGRHQRVTLRPVNAPPFWEERFGDAPMLCIDSSIGPFPEDGFDERFDVEVDEVGVHFALRDTHFARVQIEGDPFEVLVAQACLPLDAHPALVALAVDEVGTLADVLEEEIFGADRS